MKKLFFIAFLAVIGSISVHAQDTVFGVKAGLNFSKFGQDVDVDGRTSFFVGGFADIPLSDVFHVQPEVQYSAEGSEDLEANFIRLIGAAKYYPTEGLSLQAGPQFGIRVSADSVIEDATKSFDFGLVLGSEYEVQDIGLVISARYNLGIANLADSNGFDTNLGTFQLGVGYRFN